MRLRTTIAAVVAAAGAGVAAAVAAGSGAGGSATTVTVTSPAATPAAAVGSSTLTVAQISASAAPGVVEITARSRTSATPFESGGSQTAQGTGFEIDRKGTIVTSAHVVAGASSITVLLDDGKRYQASVVGIDEATDVAVLRIQAASSLLHPLSFGDSSKLAVGDAVVAIGDPYGLQDSVTSGIVSALDRTITSPSGRPIGGAIQTDADINHGNSGGPLLDGSGHVIAITSQITSGGSSDGNVGIGFAVPSNTVRAVVAQLLDGGHASHASLGVSPTAGSSGVRIARVESGSAAAAGLRAGDVIVSAAGQPVTTVDEVIAAVQAVHPGERLRLVVVRDGSRRTVVATLGSV